MEEFQRFPEPVGVLDTELDGLGEIIKSGMTPFADTYPYVPEIANAVEKAGVRAVLDHKSVTVGVDDEAACAETQESWDVPHKLDDAADRRILTTFQPQPLTTVGRAYLRKSSRRRERRACRSTG